MTGAVLPFIVSSGPKLQNDPSIRKLIRSQAMRDVALSRKKRSTHERVNVGQPPATHVSTYSTPMSHVSSSDEAPNCSSHNATNSAASPSSTSESGSSDDDSSEHDLISFQLVPNKEKGATTRLCASGTAFIPATLLSSYEIARSNFQVDVTDLAMLTNFNVGRSTVATLSADPARLMTLLGHSKWSYLQFVPSYHGLSDCLTAATDCLLARVRSVLMPYAGNKGLELRLYSRALKSLQSALQDPVSCMRADVLCAAQLLTLHELLNFTKDTAWSHHFAGSVRLVKYRTPLRFRSEFEKALFVAHIGPLVHDSLVGNTPCYLEEPQWSELYQSLAQPSSTLHDRSPLAIEVRSYMFKIPGLWHDIGKAITGPGLFDDEHLSRLTTRCRKAHGEYLDWLDRYYARCTGLSATSISSQEIEVRRELLGLALECLAFVKRLLATICDAERDTLEIEAQRVAHSILNLQKEPSSKYSWLFSGTEMGVAHSILSTKVVWEGGFSYDTDHARRMACRARYVDWSGKLRADEARMMDLTAET